MPVPVVSHEIDWESTFLTATPQWSCTCGFIGEMRECTDHLTRVHSATHRHYKGGLYRVIGEGIHTETNEPLVLYQHVWPHAQNLYARPVEMFHSEVIVEGERVPRFAKL